MLDAIIALAVLALSSGAVATATVTALRATRRVGEIVGREVRDRSVEAETLHPRSVCR